MSQKDDFQDIKNRLLEMLKQSEDGKQKSPVKTASPNNGISDGDNEQINLDFTVEEIMEDRLIQIKEALKRIKDESYGNCLDCGREIVRERLEAIPEAMFCIDCQKKKERQAKSMMNLRDTFFPDQIS